LLMAHGGWALFLSTMSDQLQGQHSSSSVLMCCMVLFLSIQHQINYKELLHIEVRVKQTNVCV
jgi:hypothetical protein